MGDEFLQGGKWVSKNNFFFLSLFGFLVYFALSQHYLFSGEQSQKKLLKRRVSLFLFFWTEMISTGSIWPGVAYCVRIHYFSTSDFKNFKGLVFSDTGNNVSLVFTK